MSCFCRYLTRITKRFNFIDCIGKSKLKFTSFKDSRKTNYSGDLLCLYFVLHDEIVQ